MWSNCKTLNYTRFESSLAWYMPAELKITTKWLTSGQLSWSTRCFGLAPSKDAFNCLMCLRGLVRGESSREGGGCRRGGGGGCGGRGGTTLSKHMTKRRPCLGTVMLNKQTPATVSLGTARLTWASTKMSTRRVISLAGFETSVRHCKQVDVDNIHYRYGAYYLHYRRVEVSLTLAFSNLVLCCCVLTARPCTYPSPVCLCQMHPQLSLALDVTDCQSSFSGGRRQHQQ